MEKAQDRLEVLEKIREYEKNGWFDRDVENDPPTRPLRPGEADFVGKKLSSRIATRFANRMAYRYFEGCLQKGEFLMDGIEGAEHFLAVKDAGAMITANHFSVFDNFAVYKAVAPHMGGRDLYKVIREGNFTSFPGKYGFFFRHCNTLPLGSSLTTLREMMDGVATLLGRGEKILIYPEQGMWWNYRKPRPMKLGAFQLAAKNNVPILPIFLTQRDTDRLGHDGFPVQALTVHILPPITPDPALSHRENARKMAEENYRLWKETYERVYGIPLSYTTEGKAVEPCSI